MTLGNFYAEELSTQGLKRGRFGSFQLFGDISIIYWLGNFVFQRCIEALVVFMMSIIETDDFA
jgi:hypothetical protein